MITGVNAIVVVNRQTVTVNIYKMCAVNLTFYTENVRELVKQYGSQCLFRERIIHADNHSGLFLADNRVTPDAAREFRLLDLIEDATMTAQFAERLEAVNHLALWRELNDYIFPRKRRGGHNLYKIVKRGLRY
jgi:hypothetical protein